MNIDLLKNEAIWKDKANTIKVMVEQETKHRPANNCKLWLIEINNQIFKSLEYQYRVGLENLNENLPEIEADLVLKTDTIEFRPSFDFLKEKYYHEIQRFITFPLKFNGVGGEGKAIAMFRKMPEENSKYMQTVYIKAEDLFDQIRNIESEYTEWTVLGQIDMRGHIDEHFTDVEDWKTNFNMLKAKRIELKKLPDQKKIDCIKINVVPFKQGVEDLFRKLSDALVDTLEQSIEKDAKEVMSFVKSAQDNLSQNP